MPRNFCTCCLLNILHVVVASQNDSVMKCFCIFLCQRHEKFPEFDFILCYYAKCRMFDCIKFLLQKFAKILTSHSSSQICRSFRVKYIFFLFQVIKQKLEALLLDVHPQP